MKQETLEEAFEKWADQQSEKGVGYDKLDVLRFGAKWQQERMYSEMDIVLILSKFRDMKMIAFSEWFEKFRKK